MNGKDFQQAFNGQTAGIGQALSTNTQQSLDKNFQKAYDKHMAGNMSAARTLYERILKKNSKHVDARYMLGTLLAETGLLESGIDAFTKCGKTYADITNDLYQYRSCPHETWPARSSN